MLSSAHRFDRVRRGAPIRPALEWVHDPLRTPDPAPRLFELERTDQLQFADRGHRLAGELEREPARVIPLGPVGAPVAPGVGVDASCVQDALEVGHGAAVAIEFGEREHPLPDRLAADGRDDDVVGAGADEQKEDEVPHALRVGGAPQAAEVRRCR